jgi:uncharacterized membrane protein YvlD (DUF360 family)
MVFFINGICFELRTHMTKLLVRILAQAVTIAFLFPQIPGIHMHGGFGTALVLALFFSVMLWAVEALASALAAVWTITTLGLALLAIVPLWILGFWIFPAVALKVVSDFMPEAITVSGWMSAVFGGLALLIVGMLTGGATSFESTVRTRSA